jgi:hypothetical protein
MRSLRTLVAALAATLVLVAAGCGSETNDYRGDVSKVQEKYFEQMNALASDVSANASSDPAAAGAALTTLAETATKLADEVAAIEPPEDKQQLADQLVGSYRALASASTELKDALASNDIEGIQSAMEALNAANADQTAAVEAFNAAD